MTSTTDPIADLVLLCRGAAEAGESWRERLRAQWIPRLLAERSPVELAAALADWLPGEMAGESSAAIERAVVEAMADDGYN